MGLCNNNWRCRCPRTSDHRNYFKDEQGFGPGFREIAFDLRLSIYPKREMNEANAENAANVDRGSE